MLREVLKGSECKINPNDEYQLMIEKQQKNRIYNPDSESLSLRDEILALVKDLSIKLKLTPLSSYTAISFVDSILSKWEIYKESAEMLALIALLISTKFHETCDLTPKTRHVYDLCKEKFGEKNIMRYESLVAGILEWEFDIQTPLHFVNYYLSKGVIFSSDQMTCYNIQEQMKSIRLFAKKVTFCVLDDYNFYQYTSLAIGACAIGLSRLEHGVKPIWPEELTELSWIPWESVEKCFGELMKKMNISTKFDKENIEVCASPKVTTVKRQVLRFRNMKTVSSSNHCSEV